MRDFMPDKINSVESGIVNLDSVHGAGSHWVTYFRRGTVVEYFYSLGTLRPPLELQRYFTQPHNR